MWSAVMDNNKIETYSQSGDTISFKQIAQIAKRNWFYFFFWVLASIAAFLLAAEYIPQKYKSKAVLNIQSSYFQHPLVSDLLSEVQDSSELSAQRLSLLRLSLNDDFLDYLGEKYQVYKHGSDSNLRIVDREDLLKKIEYFSVSPTSFQVSMSASSPLAAFEMTKKILEQMTFTLIEKRYQTLVQARTAVLKQAKVLNAALSASGGGVPQREELEAQLSKMEANLAALRNRYTDSHPDVVRLQGLKQQLMSQIQNALKIKPKPEDEYTSVFLSPASRVSSQQIFDDLLKKLSHLNVVLEMEKDRENVSYLGVIEEPLVPTRAYFPDRMQFALFGLFTGLVIASLRVIYRELKRAGKIVPERVMLDYGIEFLGELPALEGKQPLLLLAGPSRGQLMLPSFAKEN
jgi:hypothetical protein